MNEVMEIIHAREQYIRILRRTSEEQYQNFKKSNNPSIFEDTKNIISNISLRMVTPITDNIGVICIKNEGLTSFGDFSIASFHELMMGNPPCFTNLIYTYQINGEIVSILKDLGIDVKVYTHPKYRGKGHTKAFLTQLYSLNKLTNEMTKRNILREKYLGDRVLLPREVSCVNKKSLNLMQQIPGLNAHLANKEDDITENLYAIEQLNEMSKALNSLEEMQNIVKMIIGDNSLEEMQNIVKMIIGDNIYD